MEAKPFSNQPYFLVGPLRTGSSLLTRCIDDHPEAICLCESEINRALFRDYLLAYHCRRMNEHGIATEEALDLLEGRRQEDPASLIAWFEAARPRLAWAHGKPDHVLLGDKSPDFYRSPDLVKYLVRHHTLIYTTRDPRAIYASIYLDPEATPEAKAERWASLTDNFAVWSPYLEDRNILIVRYEDLIRMPRAIMNRVYRHLELPSSDRFLSPFPRLFPYRFLWNTAIDWETGIRKDFDLNRINSWAERLTADQIAACRSTQAIRHFMVRFGYD